MILFSRLQAQSTHLAVSLDLLLDRLVGWDRRHQVPHPAFTGALGI